MKYRRLGQTQLQVSEVGFGTWTLASNWWGEVTNKTEMLHAALDAGINFIDTAPVYGENGFGETLLADILAANRSDIVLTTKCGYDIAAERDGVQRERPHDWRPESIRTQLDESLRRLGTDYIDLYQLHNCRLDAVQDDDLWATLADLVTAGKVLALGAALGPAIGWVEEGIESVRQRDICSLQTVFNILEQEPGLTFAAEPKVADGTVSLISRVPHASDTLSDKVTPDTVFPKGDHRAHRNKQNMLDNFEKADTLKFLWEGTGRTKGQAAIAGILANPSFATVLPTCVNVEEVREYAAASDVPLTPDEASHLHDRFARNFDHDDRYEMPLKSSR